MEEPFSLPLDPCNVNWIVYGLKDQGTQYDLILSRIGLIHHLSLLEPR